LIEGSRKLLKFIGIQLAKKNKKGGQWKHKKEMSHYGNKFLYIWLRLPPITPCRDYLPGLYLTTDFTEQKVNTTDTGRTPTKHPKQPTGNYQVNLANCMILYRIVIKPFTYKTQKKTLE